MTVLTDNINEVIRLTTDKKAVVEKAFVSMEISKGDLWVKQGRICDQVAFVVSGKLRNYYIDDTGNEVTETLQNAVSRENTPTSAPHQLVEPLFRLPQAGSAEGHQRGGAFHFFGQLIHGN
jgi:hypothetical protein